MRQSFTEAGGERTPPGPRIVVVVAPKGGVGKTTLTMSMLVSGRRAGLRVLGVNMDGQHSLDKWAVRRRAAIERHPEAGILEVPVRFIPVSEWRDLRAIDDVDLIVVDTPPGHGESVQPIRSVCGFADLVVIPTSASGMDLDEVVPFGESIPHQRSVFVLNRVNRRTRTFERARNAIIQRGRLCPIEIPSLDVISTQFMRGLASTDFDDPGREAFDALWHFVRQEVGLQPGMIDA